ncbi:hypothetical protein PMAYCL1PPCAC_18108 [Pristionchus mayeri]|uniref:Protein piccolo n=1 Tax=Pristionchus mayeri TaxID=1317129 RepID=A0AAN5CNW5_9BILA|nr:hypothetical protein PMAYCL1PPCAC_18108 [Pristionchus mayeri]
MRRREMDRVEEEQMRERERLRWEEEKRIQEENRDEDLLVDSSEVRDGAESRTDGCSTDEDAFAFSETGPRFELPEGVEDWQQESEWKSDTKPRMWTTVFESDESESVSVERDDVFPLPPSGSVANQSDTQSTSGSPMVYRNRYSSSSREDNSPVDAIEMDEVYDNFSIAEAPSPSNGRTIPSTVSGGFRFDRGQEIEFDSTPRSLPSSSLPRASIPEISVTIHETPESDEEESGGEHTSDDEDYPDKVISAPVAAPISFEEVEREREVNEAAATQMLHQIQALGDEAANDEFDVQWAHSQLKKTSKSPPVSVPSSSPSSLPPESSTDSEETSRKNPFLEDDDVKVDMEELNTDYSQAAAYYAGMGSGGLINHRPGPVYTITEEDEGERVMEGDAKSVAREKARRTAAAATKAILSFYEQQKEEEKKIERIARPLSSITSIPPTESKTTMTTKTTTTAIEAPTPSKGDGNYTQFSLPSYSSVPSSSSLVTIPPPSFSSTLEEVAKDLPARIIDPALQISAVAEPTDVIDHSDRLFEAVYRNESADSKPNLLFYDDSSFIALGNDGHGTSTSPSFLIPNTGDLSSDESPSTPSKLKRSPAMMMPPERKIIDPVDPSSSSTPFVLPPYNKRTEDTAASVSSSILKDVSPVGEKTTATSVGSGKSRADGPSPSALPASAADSAPSSKITSSSASQFFPDKAFQYNWMKQLEDDAEWLAASTSSQSEMGRRKLPSIPPPITSSSIRPVVSLPSSTLSSSLTRSSKPSAPIYITSPMVPPPSSSAPSSHLFSLPPQSEPFTRPSSALNRSLYDLSRPSSASSTLSYGVASIQAGCPFQSSSFPSKPRGVSLPSPRQPISMVGKHYKSPSLSKLPSTLARVKLKKELKEAVNRRRESLEATEIEANQRQYVVHKMLVTGLLPEPREDELPKVIPCLLPVELVEGARVTPTAFPRYESTPSEPIHSKREAAVSTEGAALWREEKRKEPRSLSDEPRRIHSMKTEGTQTEAPLRESPLRLMRYEDERESRERQREVRHEREMMETEERRRKTDDLIDATRRYFEEYDRQLREIGERGRTSAARKHLNLSSEDDALARETRRLQILEELDRKRRERERLFGEEYGRRRDHYGSLPRMDRNRSPRSRGDYTLRENDPLPHYQYGSLPRNLERFGGGPQIQVDYEQAFGSGPSHFPTSRSLYDLYGEDPLVYDDITRTSNVPIRGRSLGYLDQLGVDSDRLLLSAPYEPHRQSTDMISQYANYLSRQFGDSTLGGSSFDHPTLPPPAPLSIPPQREMMVDPPFSDPYYPSLPLYPPPSTPYTSSSRQPLPSHLPPAMAPLSDPYSTSHVYSRSESNYGARPSFHSLDYGNLHRQVIPPQTWTSGGAVQRTSAAYPPSSLTHGYSQPLLESSYLGGSSLSRPTEGNRSWSNGNLPDDALSRVYHSAGRRRAQENRANNNPSGVMSFPLSTTTSRFYDHQLNEKGGAEASLNHEDLFATSTLGRQKRQTTFASTDDVISASGGRRRHESAYRRATSSGRTRPGNVKRLLLLRKYKDHNIYNDLGVRVVGGKRMGTGELGAFVSAVNSARHCNTLGQIAEGDQVLEWNGVLLTGKTFEEVERIVNASTGEVEILIKSHSSPSLPSSLSLSNRYEDRPYDTLPALRSREFSPDRTPPVPQHRSKTTHSHHLSNGHLPYEDVASPVFDVYPPVNGFAQTGVKHHQYSALRSLESLGHLQVALSYEHPSQRLIVRALSARGLKARDSTRGHAPPNPFVKIYLLPGRKVSHKRRTRFVPSSADPEWNQLVEYDISWSALPRMHLEFSLWDYDKFSENNSLGQVIVSLNDSNVLTGISRWYKISSLEIPLNGQTKDLNPVYSNGVGASNGTRVPYRSNYSYNPTNLDIGYPAIK